ncbi:hypothetical protein VCR17J2_100071 [Vibrio coralliirubri]|nr:hypothetical protein VCR17J2_100071 [Vibrio coralliirubri]
MLYRFIDLLWYSSGSYCLNKLGIERMNKKAESLMICSVCRHEKGLGK